MSKTVAFKLKRGARLLGQGGTVLEVVSDPVHKDRHDVSFAVRFPDGQEATLCVDMWTELNLATVLDDLARIVDDSPR